MWLILIGIIIISIISTIAGIGGGGFLISYLSLVTDYNFIKIVPIIQAIIFGSSIYRVIKFWFSKSNESNYRYLLDLTPITLIIPFDASASYLGVFLLEYFPNIITLILICLIMGFSIYKIITRAIIERIKDNNNMSEIVEFDGIIIENYIKPKESNYFKKENIYERIKNLIPIFFSILITFIIGINKSSYNICSHQWWILSLINTILCVIIGILAGFFLIKQYQSRKKNKFHFLNGDIRWSFTNIIKLTFVSILSGLLSTYLGIGGGSILLPILYSFKMKPQVIVATTSIGTLFSSLISLLNFIFNNQISLIWIISGSLSGLIGSIIGTIILKKYFLKNSFLLSVFISIILFFSTIILNYNLISKGITFEFNLKCN